MNQNNEKQAIKATELEEKKGKLPPGQYNSLYSKIGKTICTFYPEMLEKWKNQGDESGKSIDDMLENIKLVLDYSRAHSRFVESLKSGLLH